MRAGSLTSLGSKVSGVMDAGICNTQGRKLGVMGLAVLPATRRFLSPPCCSYFDIRDSHY